MKLEDLIITKQQEIALEDFREFQKETNWPDSTFFGWYVSWQFDHGLFSDSDTIKAKFYDNYAIDLIEYLGEN